MPWYIMTLTLNLWPWKCFQRRITCWIFVPSFIEIRPLNTTDITSGRICVNGEWRDGWTLDGAPNGRPQHVIPPASIVVRCIKWNKKLLDVASHMCARDHQAVVLSCPYLARRWAESGRRWAVLERCSAWLVVNRSKGVFQRNPQP